MTDNVIPLGGDDVAQRIEDYRAQLDNIVDIQVAQARIIERQATELSAYSKDLERARDHIDLLMDMNRELRTDLSIARSERDDLRAKQ